MKKLSYSNLKSHPNKFLEDHLENVANFSKLSFISLSIENNILFSEIAYLIGLGHDFAKATSFFQNYLLNNISSENSHHGFLSAVFTYYIVKKYVNENELDFDKNLAIISYIVVLHHHGNIKNISRLFYYHDKKLDSNEFNNQINNLMDSKDSLEKFYNTKDIYLKDFFIDLDNVCVEISQDLLLFNYDSNYDNYFLILLFYSGLIDADKMDASNTNIIKRENIPSNCVDEYKKKNSFNLDGINKIREEAYIEVNNNVNELNLEDKIYSINLPTGIGKTLTGFSSAVKLKNRINDELGINPRIIYSLPFLSVIDQNEKVIKDIFNENNLEGNNYLLKHNHLSNITYDDGEEEYSSANSKILIEGWNSEVIITTFIQLFYSLIGNKNSFLRKFHNITNSIIILDEIQSVPHKYWGIINEILTKLAYEFNCWVILMTATQPFIFKENEIISLVDNVDYYFNQFNRVDYNFNLEKKSLDEFNEDIINLLEHEKNKNVLIVLNTISSSLNVYESIKDYYGNDYEIVIDGDGICHVGDDIDLIYLSTNILPYHRLKKIKHIKNSDKQKIIVSTQLIEAGVDIDVDIVYRDFAPLDSIIQTAGRCNRGANKEKGLVNVINLINENEKAFSNFIYHNILLSTTREILNELSNNISEKDFNLMASNRYFDLISKRSFDDEKLKKCLNNLNFNQIPDYFKLIENLPNKIDVFVCINEEAEKLFNKYKYIVENLSGFKRNDEFLKIKSDFHKFVISVHEKDFGSANVNGEIGVIYPQDLSRKYKSDSGFIPSKDEDSMIW